MLDLVYEFEWRNEIHKDLAIDLRVIFDMSSICNKVMTNEVDEGGNLSLPMISIKHGNYKAFYCFSLAFSSET